MINYLREKFNTEFSVGTYNQFLNKLNSILSYPTGFRVAETPVFLPPDLKEKLITAGTRIVEQISNKNFLKLSGNAVPESLFVPNQTENPEFFQIDFAISEDDEGELTPKLVELQGFPSMYGYQYYLSKLYKEFFRIPEEMTSYFGNYSDKDFIDIFKKTILNGNNPEEVILLEIEPLLQKTRIDFSATEKLTGIKTVAVSQIKKHGNKLFYNCGGREIRIKRIYNRVIFDELIKKNIKLNFDFSDDLDVQFACHPNWYFLISKFSLPLLNGKFVPKSYYLNDLKILPDNLDNYVLKPLYSFAGSGVIIDLNKDILNKITDKENYILQEKINYKPVISTPEGKSKMEIRLMYIWDKEPVLVHNLVRLSKGKMIGVDFNKNKTWVGSSIAFHF